MNQGNPQAQMEGLATLLVLDDEIRKVSTIREYGFFTTNETHRLIPYHTCYLWGKKEFIGTYIVAQSGTAELDIHAPVNQWLKNKINQICESPKAKEVQQFDTESPNLNASPNIPQEWRESLPGHFLWCPLFNKAEELNGGLIFFRETAFSEGEVKMLRWLLASYQYTWKILAKPKVIAPWQKLKQRPYFIALTVLIIAIIFFPIRLSVIGSGTVTPSTPVLINAPMQGVIKSFAVNPGDTVKKGQLLLTLDKTDFIASAEVNQKNYLLTQAKLRTAINEGFTNKNSRIEIPVLEAQLQIDKARYDYTNTLLAKADITSPADGIVIFDSKEDWVGQPVNAGERILIVADPHDTHLKITIPVSDIIKLKVGDQGEFFVYGQFSSIPIVLTNIGYNAKLLPNKSLAYEFTAAFSSKTEELPQLGAKGTVRVYGRHVPFIYFILRRPLQTIRQTLGM